MISTSNSAYGQGYDAASQSVSYKNPFSFQDPNHDEYRKGYDQGAEEISARRERNLRNAH